MATTAQEIASIFDNDGQVFESAEGVKFSDIVPHEAARTVGESPEKYIFRDGSSLIEYANCWDFALLPDNDDCFCMGGLKYHEETCPLSEESIAEKKREEEY